MKTIEECFKQIKNRPVIVIYTAIMTLALCLFEQFNPAAKRYGSLSVLFKQRYVDTLAMFAEDIKSMAKTPLIMVLNIIVVILAVLAVSAILGIFGAGHGHTFYLSFVTDKKRKGEFNQGINKHYVKVMLFLFFSILLSALFVIMTAYVIIPAVMSVKMVLAGDSSYIFMMLALCVLTISVVYMSTVFFAMIISFVFPSVIAYKKGGVTVAFRMVKGYCWYLIPRTTLFLFVMLLIKIGLLAVGYGFLTSTAAIAVLLANWVLKTVTLFIYLYFVFGAFMGMKEDMFPSYAE